MKDGSKIALLLAGVAAVLFARRNKCVSGIGVVKKRKRRIWHEVEVAQKHGIDLSRADGWLGNEKILNNIMLSNHATPSASRSDKPVEERYFNQLRRVYKSIAGTTLPYKESVVRNENDDVILIYRDYELDRLYIHAAEYIRNSVPLNDNYEIGYWYTIADIATGSVKFVWNSKEPHRGIDKLVFGQAAPMERKKRISYLASAKNGGLYPEIFAHRLWEGVTNGEGDDKEILDGVIDAIRECDSVGEARDMITARYIQDHQEEEFNDTPF